MYALEHMRADSWQFNHFVIAEVVVFYCMYL